MAKHRYSAHTLNKAGLQAEIVETTFFVCRLSFLEYPKRNDFFPRRIQKKQPDTTLVFCRICQERLETKLLLVKSGGRG